MATQANLPQKKQWEVKYLAGEVEITLNPDIIKNYLVRGKPDLVTLQEMAFFMGICRARGLNPFAGDCYLIKYTQNDPAAIITSIDFKRARAAAQENCQGWTKGIICQKPDGTLRYSNGLIMAGETLVGGWFKATPKGWVVPFELEVNLKGYLKKTSEGKITRFWQEENQPTMIAKVAESQGLSACWPRDLGKLYTTDEIPEEDAPPSGPLYEMGENGGQQESPPPTVETFVSLAKARIGKEKGLSAALNIYLSKSADVAKKTADEIMVGAVPRFDDFWKSFLAWNAIERKKEGLKNGQQPNQDAPGSTKGGNGGDSTAQEEKVDLRPSHTLIPCPKGPVGEKRTLGWCRDNCIANIDCQEWRN